MSETAHTDDESSTSATRRKRHRPRRDVTLDPELEKVVAGLAGPRGFSSFIDKCIRKALATTGELAAAPGVPVELFEGAVEIVFRLPNLGEVVTRLDNGQWITYRIKTSRPPRVVLMGRNDTLQDALKNIQTSRAA